MINEQIVLSIETGVRGGSLSLLKNNSEIDFWIGEGQTSKAEEILEQIARLLEKNNISKSRINSIAVSEGPGSQTGLRIGEALAHGLRKSIDCSLAKVPLLRAMAMNLGIPQRIVAAVSFGKNQIHWQSFYTNDNKLLFENKIISSSPEDLIDEIRCCGEIFFIMHQSLYDILIENFDNGLFSQIEFNITNNLARELGNHISKNNTNKCV